MFSFLNNWKWEMLHEKQYAMKTYSNALKLFQSLQYNIRPLSYSIWSYCVFVRKFVAATKILNYTLHLTNYTFFVKPTCSLPTQETRRWMTNVSLTLSKLTLTKDKHWHSVNLFYCKSYTRGVFRTNLP